MIFCTNWWNITKITFITGPPNGPVLFCTLVSVVCRLSASSSSVGVCNAGRVSCQRAGRRARRRSAGQHSTTGQYGYVPLRWHVVYTPSRTCKILKLAYYQNYCTDSKQILHQILLVGGPNSKYTQNKFKMLDGGHFKNKKIFISQQRLNRSAPNWHGDAYWPS